MIVIAFVVVLTPAVTNPTASTINLLLKSKDFQDNNTRVADNYNDFKKLIDEGGFVLAHWDGTEDTEMKIKNETKATIRCIPESNSQVGKCIISGNKSLKRVYFAKSY